MTALKTIECKPLFFLNSLFKKNKQHNGLLTQLPQYATCTFSCTVCTRSGSCSLLHFHTEILPASTVCPVTHLTSFSCYFFITLPVSALHGCFSRALLDLPAQDPSLILAHWLVSAPRRGGWSLSDPAPLLWGCDFWASWACTSFQHFVFWGWSQPGIWAWHNLQLPPSKANGPLIIGVSFCRKYSEKIFSGSPHLNGKYHSEYI